MYKCNNVTIRNYKIKKLSFEDIKLDKVIKQDRVRGRVVVTSFEWDLLLF